MTSAYIVDAVRPPIGRRGGGLAKVRGGNPIWMLTAPIKATEYALKQTGLTAKEIDLVEINEAFASVMLAW